MKYAIIEDGQVIAEREIEPRALDNPSGPRIKVIDGKPAARPIREVKPPIDETIERYGEPATLIKDAEVVRTWPVVPIPLAELVDSRQDAIDAHRDGIAGAGFAWNGKTFDIDERTVLNIVGTMALALAAQGNPALWPADFEWIARDNSRVPMTSAQVVAFAKTAFEARRKAIMNARAHKDAVATLADAKAVVGYDFLGGWV